MFETARNVKAVTIVMRNALAVVDHPIGCIRYSLLLPCECLPELLPFGLLSVVVCMWFKDATIVGLFRNQFSSPHCAAWPLHVAEVRRHFVDLSVIAWMPWQCEWHHIGCG